MEEPDITLIWQPAGNVQTLKRPKTVKQLLQKLNLEEEDALVIRDGKLLTPDRRIFAGETILVRQVGSTG